MGFHFITSGTTKYFRGGWMGNWKKYVRHFWVSKVIAEAVAVVKIVNKNEKFNIPVPQNMIPSWFLNKKTPSLNLSLEAGGGCDARGVTHHLPPKSVKGPLIHL